MPSPRVMGTIAALLVITPAFNLLPAPAGGEQVVYTLADALRGHHDLKLLQSPAQPPRRTGVVSSADPNGGTFHRGNVPWDDGTERILFHMDGPGVITRIWTDSPAGDLRFRWDHDSTPQWRTSWRDLAAGSAPPFEYPFIDTGDIDSTMTFPLPFAGGMKITVTPEHTGAWEIHYEYFDPGTKVQSWWPAMGPTPEVAAAFTAAENALLEPESVTPPGDLLKTMDVLVDPLGGTTWSPEEPVLITGLELFQITGDTPPGELHFHVRTNNGDEHGAPWGLITGGTHDRKGTAGLITGRQGRNSWIRAPFLLEPDDEIAFSWEGESDGDYVGRLKIWGDISLPEGDHAPRLALATASKPLQSGDEFQLGLPGGNGRLLYIGASARGGASPWYLDATTSLHIDNEPPLRFGGLGGLFSAPRQFGPFDRRSALGTSILNTDKTSSRFTGALAFAPHGISHEQSATFKIDASQMPDMGDAPLTVALLGQTFGPPLEPLQELPTGITVRPWDHDRQMVRSGGDDRLPRIESHRTPLVPRLHPAAGWLEPGENLEGELDLRLEGDDLLWAVVHLDLPRNWRGELSHNGTTVETRELGWPNLRLDDITDSSDPISWRIIPPDDADGGTYIAAARIVARYTGDYHHEIRRPIEIHLATRGTPYLVIDDWETHPGHEWSARIPGGFQGKPGDLLVAEFSSTPPGILHGGLTFSPFIEDANMVGRSAEVENIVPRDGTSQGKIMGRPGVASLTFPVGRHASWITEPEKIRITVPGASEETRLEGIKLYRRSESEIGEGWSRQFAYPEWPESHFRVPSYKTMIRGSELLGSLRIVSSFPGDFIDSVVVDTEFLENVEEGPLRWRISSPLRRTTGFRPRIDVARFFTDHTGSRIAIEHPSIKGAQHFAIQFAYGPWSGRVAIRDGQGRLIAWRDLAMERTVNFPHYTWFATKIPSETPIIYLETMGTAPGGESQHIMIERFMVLDEEPE